MPKRCKEKPLARVKKASKEDRPIVFADQSGSYLLPVVVRTYALVGKTSILYEHLGRDHLSAMNGITSSSVASENRASRFRYLC
jgi:hypothetical protein